ncbi:hypothetical protein BS47DRAFT_1340645 [Hydnum rufescens UP504]|uniref:Secreted protein n=1 Tax=Hydnum rufescens UP504 TaxID=1448309 RepID=A0A9P6B353_9AGAM|nr:hypothetical protein BS47DRAFT_1340645 [Hydnum rufescens UP504]
MQIYCKALIALVAVLPRVFFLQRHTTAVLTVKSTFASPRILAIELHFSILKRLRAIPIFISHSIVIPLTQEATYPRKRKR